MLNSLQVQAEGFVDVQAGRLWYEWTGDGPPIVLIHAGIADSRTWDPQLAAVASAGWRVLRFDIRVTGGRWAA